MERRQVQVSFAALTVSLFFVTGLRAQETPVERSDLPRAVQKAADEQSKGATAKSFAKEVDHGKVQYEIKLSVNGHSKEIIVDPRGNILEIEEEVTLEALPGPVRQGLEHAAGKKKILKVGSLTKHGALVAYKAQVLEGEKHSEIQLGPDGKPLAHKE